MSNYLVHSSGPWKKHKYIKKIGNKYYYNNPNVPGFESMGSGRSPEEAVRNAYNESMDFLGLVNEGLADVTEKNKKEPDKWSGNIKWFKDEKQINSQKAMIDARELRKVKEMSTKSKVNTFIGTNYAKGKNFVDNLIKKLFK